MAIGVCLNKFYNALWLNGFIKNYLETVFNQLGITLKKKKSCIGFGEGQCLRTTAGSKLSAWALLASLIAGFPKCQGPPLLGAGAQILSERGRTNQL